MRITSDKDIKEIREKGKKSIKKSQNSGIFDSMLQSSITSQREAELKKLLDDIESFGKDLLLYKTPHALKRYKKKVREFLKEIVKDYENKQVVSQVRTEDGKNKIYHVVEKVDKHLDSLREDALNKIKDNLRLVATLEELRGLVVDVFG